MISVLIPCYNESDVIHLCYDRVSSVLKTLNEPYEIVFVDDGSKDKTVSIIQSLQQSDSHIVLVSLSRNFGKEAAMTAGLDTIKGDAVIILDADLQDPPELIPKMVSLWRQEGYDVIYGQREHRLGETWLKKTTSSLFYRVMAHISDITIPRDVGDFRLMTRRVVDDVNRLRETHRFMKGIFAWVGYKSIALPYQRDPRIAGETKWNYRKLVGLAVEGITGYSRTPLLFAIITGAILCLLSILITPLSVLMSPSWISVLFGLVIFLIGLNMTFIGVLGLYIGRIFNETKQRPIYVIQDIT